VLALLTLLAMATLLVWFFVDTRFFVYEAGVQGNTLVGADEVYGASGLDTLSIFYVNRTQVVERVCREVPGVAQVDVDCRLPNRVRLRVREQDLRFAWHTSGTRFLLDGEGRALKADDGLHGQLISVRDLDDRPLVPGDWVDPAALNAVSYLHGLLPEATVFDFSRLKGVSLLDQHGWRIYFGDDHALAEKVATMRAVLRKVQSSGASIKFIDLRFVGTPYYE